MYTNGDKVYIVAITAFVNDESIRKCFKVGMVEVLHKPVNIEALSGVLDFYFFNKSS